LQQLVLNVAIVGCTSTQGIGMLLGYGRLTMKSKKWSGKTARFSFLRGKNRDIEIERAERGTLEYIRLADYCKLLKLYLQSPQLGNLNRGFKYLENIFCCS
jgi:hypothetical protein